MSESTSPYEMLGGEEPVRAIVKRFYDAMERLEPELTALHVCDAPGRVSETTRERFALFLIGWLGGPNDYMRRFGHPRLRMRHAHVRVDCAMRDAWLRAMTAALDESHVEGDLRTFLDRRFSEVADFMRNAPGEG